MLPDVLAALESGDIQKAEYVTHTMKGVAGNLSLKSLFELVAPMMASLKNGVVPEGAAAKLEEEINSTLAVIDKFLEVLSAEAPK